MNNKLFYGVIIVIIAGFVAAFFFINADKNNPDKISKSGYYPYTDIEPTDLEGPTVDKLDDENYHYNKTPEETKKEIDSGEDVFVYYWSPVCQYCMEATPKLIEAKNNDDFPLIQVNTLEYHKFQQEQGIEVTPTLVYYKDGKEVERAEGAAETAKDYQNWIKRVQE